MNFAAYQVFSSAAAVGFPTAVFLGRVLVRIVHKNLPVAADCQWLGGQLS